MSAQKCPKCGLVNFTSATECKRCRFDFTGSGQNQEASSLKCPECGLVNFASATECKRCHFDLTVPEPPAVVTVAPIPVAPAPELAVGPSALNDAAEKLPSLPEYFDAEAAPYTVVMILFGITLGLSTILVVYQLIEYANFFAGEEWKVLTNPTHRHYMSILEPLFFFQWIIKGLALSFSVIFLVLFLRKSYAFLRWFRVYLIANFIFMLADGLAVWRIEIALRERDLGRAFEPFIVHQHWYLYLYGIGIILTFVWFWYFASERTGKTFIN